jgi:hypothetical protein
MPGSTNFPASLDSHTGGNPFGFAEAINRKATTLDGALNNSATTITVVSTSGFPTRGSVAVGNEIVTYTGTSATTFTGVTRGAGGTSAVSHPSGEWVASVPTAANHNDLAAAIVAIETKLRAGAAFLQSGSAVGSASNPSTTSASYVDITDMAVTLTTGGGNLLVWFDSIFAVDTTSVAYIVALSLDGAAEVAVRNLQEDSVSVYASISLVHRFTSVAAGSHTVKARYKTNGTASLTAYLTQRSLLVMEMN